MNKIEIEKEKLDNEITEYLEGSKRTLKQKIDWKSEGISVNDIAYMVRQKDLYIPEFQRSYVWDKKMADQFIESLLMNIPIPSIYISTRGENNFYIIDGLQRIKTLIDFIENQKFHGKKNKWRLKSANNEWNGKTFDELSENDRKSIERAKFHVIIITLSKSDKSSIFNVFARINKGGTKLSLQQIRNSLYHSTNLRKINEKANYFLKEKYIDISKANENANKHEEFLLRILLIIFKFDKDNETFKPRNKSLSEDLNGLAEWLIKYNNLEMNLILEKISECFKYIFKNNINISGLKKNGKNFQKNTNPLVLETVIYLLYIQKTPYIDNEKLKFILINDYKLRSSDKSMFYTDTHNEDKYKGRVQLIKHATNN